MKADYELGKEVQLPVDRETAYPELIDKHKLRISGPLDKLIDDGKWKQTTINEGESRKWYELAHDYVAMLAFAKGSTI